MFSNGQFSDFEKSVDAFDLTISKLTDGSFELSIIAEKNEVEVEHDAVALSAQEVQSALTQLFEHVKGSLRGIVVPGIRLTDSDGNLKLTLSNSIRLEPYKANEVTRGITLTKEEISGCSDCDACGPFTIQVDGDETADELARELFDALNRYIGDSPTK